MTPCIFELEKHDIRRCAVHGGFIDADAYSEMHRGSYNGSSWKCPHYRGKPCVSKCTATYMRTASFPEKEIDTKAKSDTIFPLPPDGVVTTFANERAKAFLRNKAGSLNLIPGDEHTSILVTGINVTTGDLYCTAFVTFTVPPSFDENKQTPRG